jgi:hypothetical protein
MRIKSLYDLPSMLQAAIWGLGAAALIHLAGRIFTFCLDLPPVYLIPMLHL